MKRISKSVNTQTWVDIRDLANVYRWLESQKIYATSRSDIFRKLVRQISEEVPQDLKIESLEGAYTFLRDRGLVKGFDFRSKKSLSQEMSEEKQVTQTDEAALARLAKELLNKKEA